MAEPTLSKKRYVPLAEAARISGYTREYVERLCRIGKIPCRMMGEKTIVELDVLLSQTGTILLGGEHVGFIELDDNAPYPLIAPLQEGTTLPPEPEQKSESRSGRIAVVGETFRVEDAGTPRPPEALQTKGEKFPSNALPFFSSMGKKSGGIHIAVSTGEVSTSPLSTSKEKSPFHIAVARDDGEVSTPRTSTLKGISVMPRVVPPDFVPSIPPPTPILSSAPTAALATPIPTEMTTPAQKDMAPAHDHDLMSYSTKLPMLLSPLPLIQKVFLTVFALGLFVAPTTLGIGQVLNEALIDFGGAFRSGTHGVMAAVGLIDPDRESAFFPHLKETSRLLSAIGASGTVSPQATQNGIVVSPSTGSQTTDQAVKDAIQRTFSDPVEVIPDAKDGQSGMIRPVFQKGNSAGYIYMMVPVRN